MAAIGGGGRTGIVLREALPWPEAVQVVRTAEDTAYEAVFVPEISGREAFSTLSAFAAKTSRLLLGTGVVPMSARSPLVAAMAAATIQELSGGRFILGVGAGSPSAVRPFAPAVSKPSGRLRQYVRTVKDALAGRVVGREGSGRSRFRLEIESDKEPPVWTAALGDRMIALAGEISDGVVLNWCTPERVAEARRIVGDAAERAGRDPADVAISVYVRACLGMEEAVALHALKAAASQYASIPQYARQFQRMGLGREASVAARAFRSDRVEDVPDSLVRAVTVMGGREEALAWFDAYRDAGAGLVLCYPVAALEPFSSVLGTVLAAAPSPGVSS